MRHSLIIHSLMVWVSLFATFIFLGLFLGEGEFRIYEDYRIIRIIELILFSGISIYAIVRFIKMIRSSRCS